MHHIAKEEEAKCWTMPQKERKMLSIHFELGPTNNDKQHVHHSFVFVEYNIMSTIICVSTTSVVVAELVVVLDAT